jgi:hypothetical protein
MVVLFIFKLLMRKKLFIGISAVAVVAVAAVNVNYALQSNDLPAMTRANIEALAGETGSTGNTVTCYSSSESKSGATYYDCGPCTKQFNSKGTGDARTCVTSN